MAKKKQKQKTLKSKLLLLVFKGSLLGLFFLGIGYLFLFQYLARQNPDGMYARAKIKSGLGAESLVYYNDGQKLLGSFFNKKHRRYVKFQDIPPHIIDAIVASEDQRFFDHIGIDLVGISRAMVSNLLAGKYIQGGSTLSQQTAKNVFGREGRDLSAKLKELVQTLRLEHFFSKEDILEFYLNQFYVVGTGRGVGIAAHYFFSKKVHQLSLAEAAFIVGSVKGPFNYDPFAQKSDKALQKVLQKGVDRVAYVLGRMQELDFISPEEHDQALQEKLNFKEGTFRTGVQTALKQVEKELNQPFFQNLFQTQGIEQWKAEQLSVFTTLDATLQKKAHIALKENLGQLGVALEGFSLPKRQRASFLRSVVNGECFYGVLRKSKNKSYLQAGKFEFEIVDSKALRKKIPDSLWQNGNVFYGLALDSKRAKLLNRPKLQGALQVLRKGKILASVGGYDNLHYDRVVQAKRQFGSSWKPLLFALAHQLGWRYDDLLENRNNVIQYGRQFYFPRADHKKRGDQVTIQWAATRSENIASVYLLSHLLDPISLTQYGGILKEVGLHRKPAESVKQYWKRLRDKEGIHLGEYSQKEIRYGRVKEELIQELYLDGESLQANWVRSLPLGLGFKQQIQKAQGERKQFLKHHFYFYEKHLSRLEEVLYLGENQDGKLGAFLNQELPEGWQPIEALPFFSLKKNVWLEGKIQVKYLMALSESLKTTRRTDLSVADLYYLPQFRTLVGMRYFSQHCKAMGLYDESKEVLSMVLGANEVTLFEMTQAYQTLFSGLFYDGLTPKKGSVLIDRITNKDGEVIFENTIRKQKVLNPKSVFQSQLGLESVVRNGTGKRAFYGVGFQNAAGFLRFPTAGKTGTTNSFKNAAFIGGLANAKQTFIEGYTIGVYVGYDNNKKMVAKGLRVGGANGALPIWRDAANAVLQTQKEFKKIDLNDLDVQIQGGYSPKFKFPTTLKIVDDQTGIAGLGKKKAYQWVE